MDTYIKDYVKTGMYLLLVVLFACLFVASSTMLSSYENAMNMVGITSQGWIVGVSAEEASTHLATKTVDLFHEGAAGYGIMSFMGLSCGLIFWRYKIFVTSLYRGYNSASTSSGGETHEF